MAEWIFFGVLSAVAVGSALMMVTNRNPVHAALWLVLTFFAVAGFFLLLGSPFLMAVQVIIYTGAIMVLFLFVVMLLNLEREREPLVGGFTRNAAIGAGSLLLLVMTGAALTRSGFGAIPTPPGGIPLSRLAMALYHEWLLPFELASVLLLVAMIGAVALARKRL